jgi:hypothetical protein
MAEYKITNWSLVEDETNPFRAPEMRDKMIRGSRDDGHEVVTSAIVAVDGRRITTRSGSIYILQDANPLYVQWMKDNGFSFDPEHPMTLKSKMN